MRPSHERCEPEIVQNFVPDGCRRIDPLAAKGGIHRVRAAVALFVASGCGGNDDAAEAVDRGPTTIATGADPNGVYWDAAQNKLLLTDDVSNAILSLNGEGTTTFSTFVALPTLAPPATPTQVSLGQIARTANGSLYTTRFGFGNAGTVVEVSAARVARNLTGLDATRRRIALTVTAAGELLDTWFTTPPSPGPATTNGNLSLLSIDATGAATERELVTGLSKPVGAAVVGRTLYVSDQATGKVLSFALDTLLAAPATAAQGTTVATFTTNLVSGDPGALTADNIDLMTATAGGTLFFRGRGGILYSVNGATGAASTIATLNTPTDPGRLQVRGVAYDAANRRLFAVIHSTDTTLASHSIRIYPID